MHNFFRPGRMGNSAGSEVTHRPMAAEINRCRLELSIYRAGRKHSADFTKVISRCRELKSIPDTKKVMISRYQKMISQGIISDILISAGGE